MNSNNFVKESHVLLLLLLLSESIDNICLTAKITEGSIPVFIKVVNKYPVENVEPVYVFVKILL